MLLSGERIVALDVETTGWNPKADAIIELARVDLVDGRVGESWSSLVKSRGPVPAEVTGVHGITDAMLAGAPEPAAVVGPFREGCGDAVLAIHNAWFDLAFVNRLLRRQGTPPLYNRVIDTLGLARGLFGSGGNTLGELALRLGIPLDQAHRALPDARATAELLLALAPRWEAERRVRSVSELAALSQDAIRLTRRRTPRPALDSSAAPSASSSTGA